MDSKDLMRLHVRALFTQDDDGRLVSANASGRAPAPRFFLGRTAQGNLWWVRQNVDATVAQELRALCNAEPVDPDVEPQTIDIGAYTSCLSRHGPVERVWSGPAFVCPTELGGGGAAVRVTRASADVLSPYLDDWRVDVESGVPAAASLDGDRAVSVCCSVRVTERAHEAGVETHPDFRGLGHGSRAVAEWAAAVRELGCVPLYSTSWENEASRALARNLGLVRFGTDLHIT
jgi:GNAT superfamily N-acetyltransferase